MHLVITDSGLGGLGICAAVERAFRLSGRGDVRLTYFNAWPEEDRGYNSLPDEATRLAFFDRALDRMSEERPDRIVIACNTLSVLFGLTRFARTSAIPVLGIIDAGVSLFHEALSADPASSIALFGTRITMESGAHRDRLVQLGIAPGRIVSVPSHGLAAAIEKGTGSAEVQRLIEECASRAAELLPSAGPVLAGLCCTHYAYVADRIRASLERAIGRAARVLDPNGALVRLVAAQAPAIDSHATSATIAVEVISKVTLDECTRTGIGQLLDPASPATARALMSYTHVPDLF